MSTQVRLGLFSRDLPAQLAQQALQVLRAQLEQLGLKVTTVRKALKVTKESRVRQDQLVQPDQQVHKALPDPLEHKAQPAHKVFKVFPES
jgi:NAD(P)H-nitrite reductase large subunit